MSDKTSKNEELPLYGSSEQSKLVLQQRAITIKQLMDDTTKVFPNITKDETIIQILSTTIMDAYRQGVRDGQWIMSE